MPESRVAYQVVQNMSGAEIQVAAPSLQRLYIDTGLALTDWHVNLNWVRDAQKITISAEAKTRELLMFDWLSQLEAAFNRDHFLARRIVFDHFDGNRIRATLWGEKHDNTRHGSVTRFKSPTPESIKIGEPADDSAAFVATVILTNIDEKQAS